MSAFLNYSFLPDAVFVNSKDNLKLVVQNPISGKPITFKSGRGGDTIAVTFPFGDNQDDLVTNLNFGSGDVPTPFTVDKNGENFVVTVTEDTTLDPGETIQITFNDIPINNVKGTAVIDIHEFIGANSGTTSVPVTKKAQELGVIIWLDPLVVGLDQKSNLQFKSAASTKVVISGYPDGKGEKSFETPPYSNSDAVGVGSDTDSQRTYVATAWAGGNQSPPESITLTQVPPLITVFNPMEEQTVGADEEITLTWKEMFGSSSEMKWLQTRKTNVLAPFTSNPGMELTDLYNIGNHNAQFMPESVTYSLLIHGFKKPAQHDFVFKVKPVQLVFLKYKKDDLTEIAFALDPMHWKAVDASYGNNSLTLKIYQPGFTQDVFYLNTEDTTHPMIQFFEIVDGNLSWITANLKSLRLDPGDITIEEEKIKKGIYTIPKDATSVTLTGIGNNGQTVRSVLEIPQSVGKEKMQH
ncbi:hypothetical protein SAMN04489724_0099 [Algoriphagus locisalis]|uniref:Uncharacterized protein n=1 Tax=Algoriphagus locisalis TaxID=305507 RepID=A0A1I7E578_9BACT|nr:hypothetical protein [Algoriphagus locisalis]SFU19097.1 hypothetical protein SAMN04489724_0099 [Algoriphagus locisalis]